MIPYHVDYNDTNDNISSNIADISKDITKLPLLTHKSPRQEEKITFT
ncbi:MAG TPA: hypothetical protein VE076_13205 [Nitrososphaeraceae archaeon]|nr:hypothetical protein [Nitrososphaeraceae archaeon]